MYAAAAVPAFPEESTTARSTRRRRASVASSTAPRSLKDSVGIRKSSFSRTPDHPAAGTSGESPSPIDTEGSTCKGRTSWYRHSEAAVGSRPASRAGSSIGEKSATSSSPPQPHRHARLSTG